MKLSGVNTQSGEYGNILNSKMNSPRIDFTEVMSAASKQAERQDEGDVLGITMLKEPGTHRFWGMKAKYACCSTPENPVIYVETNYGGKKASYNVNINEVDPNHASRLEMFALCAYADATGIGDKSTFGTYSTLGSFEEMAKHNGYIDPQMEEPSVFDQFKNEKLNWVNMSKQVTDLLYKCHDFQQYQKGLSIINLFSQHLGKQPVG